MNTSTAVQDAESTVYGLIRHLAGADPQTIAAQRTANIDAITALGQHSETPYLHAQMFAQPLRSTMLGTRATTQLIQFAATYPAIEYEWHSWMKDFERLLMQMYWHCVTVHLETELMGRHTFIWEADDPGHRPGMPLQVRCEWERDSGMVRML